MNELIEKLAADAGLLNYVDNETPRRYYIDGHADLEEVERFARLIVKECLKIVDYAGEDVENGNIFFNPDNLYLKALKESDYKRIGAVAWYASDMIKEHFGIEE